MKRPIISERMFLYWTDREHPNTCRMTVRMQDTIGNSKSITFRIAILFRCVVII